MTTIQITRSGHPTYDTHTTAAAAGSDHRPDQPTCDAQGHNVGPVQTPPQAKSVTTPTQAPPAGAPSTGSGQSSSDAQPCTAAAGTALPADHCSIDHHSTHVGGGSTRDGSAATKVVTTPTGVLSLSDPFLALAADVLDDAQDNRIANENRLRQLTRTDQDSDGEERGFGLDQSHPDVARLATIVDMLATVEHQATLNLQRMLRAHPLGPWMKAQKGIGEKQGARLLAVIGDPYLNAQTGQPRTVSQLWAYCGHGDPTRRRRKGMTQADLFTLGNPVAKSRLWLISCACIKAQGPYADVYYARKVATVDRTHTGECVRCGPSGHPAQPGSAWSDAHRHADALRVTGKTILRDLWLEARRLHGTAPTDVGGARLGESADASPTTTRT